MKKSLALLVLASVLSMTACNNNNNDKQSSTSSPTSTTTTSSTSSSKPSTSTSSSSSSSSSSQIIKTTLAAPVVTVDEEKSGVINWNDVENADYYLVYVNGSEEGVEVVGTTYKVPLTDAGLTSTVTVKSMTDDEEHFVNSGMSNLVSVTHKASDRTTWGKDELLSDWTALSGTLGSVNEGLDLKAGQSMAIVKKITAETKMFNLFVRDFEGQETGETGAIVELKVNGAVVAPVNFETETVTIDKDCGRQLLITYDLSSYISDDASIIRITEKTGYSNHCVVTYAAMGDYSSLLSAGTKQNYWGHNYADNWSGEMSHADGMEDIANIANDPSWIKVGNIGDLNEGLKLEKEASIVKYLEVTEANSLMTVAFRNFGGIDEDFAGGVSVNGKFLKAVGDNKTYFTKLTTPTYLAEANDGGQEAVMKTYDLSAYIGKTVCLTIANLKCYAPGGNEDLVIGSVSFGSAVKVTDTRTTFDASLSKNIYPNLPLMVAGPFTVYNEGISFRTNDYAGGIAQRFDLSEVAEGKHVYVRTYWRGLVEDNITAKFQTLVNGELINTYDYLLRDREDNLACVGLDLSNFVGQTADVAIHIPSRNYRVVLTKVEYYTTDEVEDNLSYPATEDPVIVETTGGEFAWGHNYKDNWGGEMGDDNLKYSNLAGSGWTYTGDVNDGFNEGCKIGYGASVTKTLTIDQLHQTMAISARSFGRDFKGRVSVIENEVETPLAPIGYQDTDFTQNGAATHKDSVEDGCQNAIMYAYDLSAYLNKEVKIKVENTGTQDSNYCDELVVGSIGFTSVLKVTESLRWDASTVKGTNNNQALQVIPCGPFSIYNEGINFRTQDFASGITKTLDLSDEALTGKTVKVKVGFRNFNSGGEDIEFQSLLNGALVSTETKKINEDITYLEFDLTQLIGQSSVNLGIRTPSRTYRIVMTDLVVTVE